jgi:hypothetical protein
VDDTEGNTELRQASGPGRMRLAREPGTGSGEQGKRERGVGTVVRNPEIDKFHQK